MKIDLSGLAQRDRDAIQALADSKDFSVQTLVVQALRLYSDVDKKFTDGEICHWSGDEARARAFTGNAELEWDNGAQHWDYPLVAISKESRSIVLFHSPGCGTMLKNKGAVLTKPGNFGTGYDMMGFIPQEFHTRKVAKQMLAISLRIKWRDEGLEAMNETLTRIAEGGVQDV